MKSKYFEEKKRLEQTLKGYVSKEDFDRYLIEFGSKILFSHAMGPDVLEVGCADGFMTGLLASHYKNVDTVEGKKEFIAIINKRKPKNVRIFHSLIEEFEPKKRYDDIIMARILEHIQNPIMVLKKVSNWLKPKGRIHIIVPNANSLNRRIGQAMGMIKKRTDLDKHDLEAGHRRVYTRSLMERHLNLAKLEVVFETGIFLKPLSNKQMLLWPKEIIDALFIVGKDFPEICTEIYYVATNRREVKR